MYLVVSITYLLPSQFLLFPVTQSLHCVSRDEIAVSQRFALRARPGTVHDIFAQTVQYLPGVRTVIKQWIDSNRTTGLRPDTVKSRQKRGRVSRMKDTST